MDTSMYSHLWDLCLSRGIHNLDSRRRSSARLSTSSFTAIREACLLTMLPFLITLKIPSTRFAEPLIPPNGGLGGSICALVAPLSRWLV